MPKAMTAWEYFVVRHSEPRNLALHFASFVVYWTTLSLALFAWDARWLLVWAPSGLIGTLGHYLFKDGQVSAQETAFSPAVPFYVTRMFYGIARGTYFDEVRNTKAKFGLA